MMSVRRVTAARVDAGRVCVTRSTKGNGRPTLRHVAQRAGVSVMTVSNVINQHPHVTQALRDRVAAAIEELGYQPSFAARNLRRARSGVVALAVPELDIPYFAELSREIIRAADRRSWTVLIEQTEGKRLREQMLASGRRNYLVDGVVFFPVALRPADLVDRADQTPLVLFGGRGDNPVTDHVVIDNVEAAEAATAHLIGIGRSRIATIGPAGEYPGGRPHSRLTGYRHALARAGLPYIPGLVKRATAFHRADGELAMRQLLDLDPWPDAVFCFSDLLALGALRALQRRGIRVPDDIALIGFDDIEEGRFSTPTLSTVAPAKERIAEAAIDLLARRLDGDSSTAPTVVTAAHTLIVRESTTGRGRQPSTAARS